jgi:hypothetical protein
MIWLLPHTLTLNRQQVFFVSLAHYSCVSLYMSLLTEEGGFFLGGGGGKPNHSTARKPGFLQTIQYIDIFTARSD